MTPTIPTIEACRIEHMVITRPRTDPVGDKGSSMHSLFVCWHPDAKDCDQIWGAGKTQLAAYKGMLRELLECASQSLEITANEYARLLESVNRMRLDACLDPKNHLSTHGLLRGNYEATGADLDAVAKEESIREATRAEA